MMYEKSKWCPDAVEWAHRAIATGRLDVVETHFGDAVKTVSGCLRSLYEAAPGCDLVASDYSAIEAVVQAFISGEQWRMDVFRTHGKIYEMSASKITGVSFEEFLDYKKRTGNHHPFRSSIGKIAELASGYGGWINAWKVFGADDHFETDREIRDAILKWRAESPAIVEFWGGQIRHGSGWGEHWYENFGIEGAVVTAIQNPGTAYDFRGFRVDAVEGVLRIRLLSGRYLYYHGVRLDQTTCRFCKLPIWQISYMGYNTDSTKGPVGWLRIPTHGGKLFENIVQAVARDILGYALVSLEKSGWPVIMHVHDEIVCEVPEGFGTVEEMEKIMSTMPPWCSDWPVVARGGWRGKFFRKA
jgi:DNA polymerase